MLPFLFPDFPKVLFCLGGFCFLFPLSSVDNRTKLKPLTGGTREVEMQSGSPKLPSRSRQSLLGLERLQRVSGEDRDRKRGWGPLGGLVLPSGCTRRGVGAGLLQVSD